MPNNNTANTRAAENIRALMGIRKQNITQLAATLGIDRGTARSRYHGKIPYDLDEISVIAEWLGQPAERIILTPSLAYTA